MEAWRRDGAAGIRECMWAMPPVDQARLSIDLYNEGEIDAMAAAIPDDFVHDMRPTGLPGMELYKGPEGYRRFLGEWLSAFPESRLEIETIDEVGGRLFTVIRQQMRGAGSGVPVTFHYAGIFTFRDGRGAASEFHTDLEGARERFAALSS